MQEPMLDPMDLPPGLVAVPAGRRLCNRTAVALLRVERQTPPQVVVAFQGGHTTIAGKPNRAVEQMLEDSERRWLLQLDSDMQPTPDVVQR